MILTDGRHLVSTTTVEALHHFAAHIGLPRDWFQDHRIPHYDVFGRKAQQVYGYCGHGAKLVTTRELVRRAIRREGASS